MYSIRSVSETGIIIMDFSYDFGPVLQVFRAWFTPDVLALRSSDV